MVPLPRASARIRQAARDNRKAATKSEAVLWQALRRRTVSGCKFRRQHSVGQFILDFYCVEAGLAVEVDGPIHAKQRDADRVRQQALESLGIRFLRLPAALVETSIGEALHAIELALRDRPSPAHGRGDGGEG